MRFLTVKHGGLPTWAWLAIAGGGLVVGLWLRRRMQGGQSASLVPSGAVSGVSGTSYPDLGAATAGGGVAGVDSGTGVASGFGPSDVLAAYQQGGVDANAGFQNALGLVSQLQGLTGQTPGISGVTQSSGGYSTPTAPAAAAATGTSSTAAAIKKATEPFGGILRVVKKGDVTLTYYRSGRIIEQRKGHSAYVAHR